jgi:methylenetetrahydrofolate dehydrogenase (NADP+)/methenyltetrahydrofolate cyclohydrolase
MKLINGKQIAEQMSVRTKARAEKLSQAGKKPHLAVLLVGDDKASQTYVRTKEGRQ